MVRSKFFRFALLVLIIHHNTFPLFLCDAYPALQHIPYRSLGDFPTPVVQLCGLQDACATKSTLYMKSDGVSGKLLPNGKRLVGGNKVRKLEFLFADAIAQGFGHVVTAGAFGSNHALATACYAKELGLQCTALLKPQTLSDVVRFNLLAHATFGTQLVFCQDSAERRSKAEELCGDCNKDSTQQRAYYIPVGGSNAVGAVGFVNAAFELQAQIQQRMLSEPDLLYVACGSFGTVAGLLLGLELAQFKTKVVAVLVEPEEYDHQVYDAIKKLYSQINERLCQFDPSIVQLPFPDERLCIEKNFTGSDYGISTPESLHARQLLLQVDDVLVDPTYTAKAAAAMLHDIPELSSDAVVLFWNTFCPVEQCCDTVLYEVTKLPKPFQSYFE